MPLDSWCTSTACVLPLGATVAKYSPRPCQHTCRTANRCPTTSARASASHRHVTSGAAAASCSLLLPPGSAAARDASKRTSSAADAPSAVPTRGCSTYTDVSAATASSAWVGFHATQCAAAGRGTTAMQRPVIVSHTRRVLSAEAVASHWPSGEGAREWMAAEWPSKRTTLSEG